MSILIGKYEFEGPFHGINRLQEKPGLCAVLHFERSEYKLISLTQAYNIREQIETSPATEAVAGGTILFATFYTENSGRRERAKMIEEINDEFGEDAELELMAQRS